MHKAVGNTLLNSIAKHGFVLYESVARDSILNIINDLGSPIAQYDGSIFWSVKVDKGASQSYHSARSNGIPPHTDGHDLLVPPKYLALYCRQPDRYGLGVTEVCDAHQFVSGLCESTRKNVTDIHYHFESDAIKSSGKSGVGAPIYCPNSKIFRYSENYLSQQKGNADLNELIRAISFFNKGHALKFSLKAKSLLLIDNHRMWHSRTSYLDQNRHLERIWVDSPL